MTNDEIMATLKKLCYQVTILGETIDSKKHPVESLIMENNWGREELEAAYEIFERWDARLEEGDKISSGQFERDFNEALGVTDQGLKSIVLAFYRNDQWTNVCEAYVDSFGKAPALEFHSIMRRER